MQDESFRNKGEQMFGVLIKPFLMKSKSSHETKEKFENDSSESSGRLVDVDIIN